MTAVELSLAEHFMSEASERQIQCQHHQSTPWAPAILSCAVEISDWWEPAACMPPGLDIAPISGSINAASPYSKNSWLAIVRGETGDGGAVGGSSNWGCCQASMNLGVPCVLHVRAGLASRSTQSKGSLSGRGRIGTLWAVLRSPAARTSSDLRACSEADLDSSRGVQASADTSEDVRRVLTQTRGSVAQHVHMNTGNLAVRCK